MRSIETKESILHHTSTFDLEWTMKAKKFYSVYEMKRKHMWNIRQLEKKLRGKKFCIRQLLDGLTDYPPFIGYNWWANCANWAKFALSMRKRVESFILPRHNLASLMWPESRHRLEICSICFFGSNQFCFGDNKITKSKSFQSSLATWVELRANNSCKRRSKRRGIKMEICWTSAYSALWGNRGIRLHDAGPLWRYL